MNNIIGNPHSFFDKVFNHLRNKKVNIDQLEIDHLCYRTQTYDEYQMLKIKLSPFATYLGAEMVNGRPIAAFKLKDPIQYNQYTISILEVPAPKPNSTHLSGLEHIEVVIKESFDDFIKKHPHIQFVTKGMSKNFNPELEIEFEDCAIKFHHQSLEDVIASEQNYIPKNFVNLMKEIPYLIYEANYATKNNFTKEIVPGYTNKLPLLTKGAALQLKNVALALTQKNLGLWLFDSYRPQKAVNFFKAWSMQDGAEYDSTYFPHIKKSQLFSQGFLSERSSHSRGSTLDLTLYDLKTKEPLDMGTIFDFFDEASYSQSDKISSLAQANRNLLIQTMDEFGFRNYSKEWWHFTFRNEAFPFTYFDFNLNEFWPY